MPDISGTCAVARRAQTHRLTGQAPYGRRPAAINVRNRTDFTGHRDQAAIGYPGYPFVKPTTYAGVAELLANADKVFIY